MAGGIPKTIYTSCAKGVEGNDTKIDDYLKVFPNPVSNFLYVEIDVTAHVHGFQTKSKVSPTYEVFLYDRTGNMVRQQKTKDGKVEFNVSNLTNGIYYLIIFDDLGSTPATRQIVVEH